MRSPLLMAKCVVCIALMQGPYLTLSSGCFAAFLSACVDLLTVLRLAAGLRKAAGSWVA